MKLYAISNQEGKEKHLYFLPGQILASGKGIDSTLRIQIKDRAYRDSFPQLTIFEVDNAEEVTYSSKNFYTASKCTVKAIASVPSSTGSIAETYSIVPKGDASVWKIRVIPNEVTIINSTGTHIKIDRRISPKSRPSYPVTTVSDKSFTRADISSLVNLIDKGVDKTSSSAPSSTTTTTSSTTTPEEPKKEEVVMTWIDTVFEDKSLKCPESKKDGFFMTKQDWRLLIRNIKRHVNTLITGPAGTGKTSCVKQAADRLGLPLYTFDMGAMVDPISSLLGVHRLQDGKSIFDYAQFTKVIQEPCIILLDELSRAPMGVGNVLFPCLDDRRVLPIEIAGGEDKRCIPVHPEVTFIATANIGAEYTGTTTLDRALTNRFFPLELGYLPVPEEEKVLVARTGITPENSKLIVKVANTIRTMNQKMEISTSVSVRETLMISALVSDGWELGDAMKSVYIPMFSGENGNEGERGKIIKMLASF